jgi:DeoR family glycerol-3-phosphate regulon repressor
MNLNIRQRELLGLLEATGSRSIVDLAEHFQVSDETIRRDLRVLSQDGLVEKFHGHVRLGEPKIEAPFDRRLKEMTEAKRAIAAATAEHIENGATVLLDNSSTSCFLARALLTRENLTAITFSIEVAQILASSPHQCRVIVPGGELRAHDRTIIGPSAIEFASQFTPDYFAFSVAAASAARGCLDFDLFETELKRAMMVLAGKVVLMIDSSKFSKSGLIQTCDWSAIDVMVSDHVPGDVMGALAGECTVVTASHSSPAAKAVDAAE